MAKDIKVYNPALTDIHPNAQIGKGTRIGVFTRIGANALIGEDCVIGSHCNICEDTRIGKKVSIQTGVHVTRGVVIGDFSFIGPGVITMNTKYMLHQREEEELVAPKIGKWCRIGGGSCLLPGIRINDHALVGAGSVVTKDIPYGAKAYGNPAKVKGHTKK